MRVLYRADGGHPIGTGHVYRAERLLRQLLRTPGVEACVLTAEEPATERILEGLPARVDRLAPRTDRVAVKPRLQAAPMLERLTRETWDLVVVDMLDTPAEDMRRLREVGVPIATFDDRGPGRIFADTIVNVLVTEPEPARLPAGTRLLEGGPYVTLDRPYRDAAQRCSPRRFDAMGRVLVAMGGADAAGLTVKVARALTLVPAIERVELACGPAFPHRADLDAVLEGAPWGHTVRVGLPSLIEPLRAADLAIVAGGLTMYEACCVGAPALAVCQPIDHQLELSERLAAAGAMATVGYGLESSEELIAHAVGELARDPQRRRALSARGPALVDGRGTERTAAALMETTRRGHP